MDESAVDEEQQCRRCRGPGGEFAPSAVAQASGDVAQERSWSELSDSAGAAIGEQRRAGRPFTP
jgi:hypothetical protein